ncbi:MAG: hypothetical protein AB7U83_07915 [Vicinamibacterales bacterium]
MTSVLIIRTRRDGRNRWAVACTERHSAGREAPHTITDARRG